MTILPSILGGTGVDFLRLVDDFGKLLAYFGHVFGCSCWRGYAFPDFPLLTWFSWLIFGDVWMTFGRFSAYLDMLWAAMKNK